MPVILLGLSKTIWVAIAGATGVAGVGVASIFRKVFPKRKKFLGIF